MSTRLVLKELWQYKIGTFDDILLISRFSQSSGSSISASRLIEASCNVGTTYVGI